MRMHWDGNTDVLEERNIISALGVVGKNVGYLDFPRLTRVTEWIPGLLPPRFEDRAPEPIDRGLAQRGAGVYGGTCAVCHASNGIRVGRVEPIHDLATDPERINDFAPELADALNRLGTDAWKLRNFKPQTGYTNSLLDGVWLRSPYLHNGSVPTLRDLLNKPEQRPKKFCRGSDLYDWKNVGYVSAIATSNGTETCGVLYLYDTSVAGNSNSGHLYGTELPETDKAALLEYLKTL
jgi:hypothetical protein